MKWTGRTVVLRLAAIVFLLQIVGACAPTVMLPGPEIQQPELTDEAITMADGVSLPLHVWRPSDTPPTIAVIALHGFNDYGTFFNDVATYLADKGVVSYAYDQRGFGAASNPGYWAGSDTYVSDLKAAYSLVKQQHAGLPVYLFGESMGGAVLIAAAASRAGSAIDPDGYILAAPAVWARETMPFYQRWALWLVSHTMPWLQVSGRGLKIKPSDNIEMLRALGRDPLVIKDTRVDAVWGLVNLMDRALSGSSDFDDRALILYGAKDEIIKKNATREMLNRLPEVPSGRRRITIYEDGYHMLVRDLAAETYWQDIAAWMRDPTAPLPSGADQSGVEALAN